MKTKQSVKVLSTLSLAASDTREETLKSVVISTVFEKEPISQNLINVEIRNSFGFDPYPTELAAVLKGMLASESIVLVNGFISLSDEEKYRIVLLEGDIKKQEKERFEGFKNFITDELEIPLEIAKIKLLYSVFIEYLYQSFYEFGEDAIKYFNPQVQNSELSNEDYIQGSFQKLGDKNLCSIFKTIIDKYPENISREDLEFLNELALKTQSFASLGINPDQEQEVINLNLVDWVLYLDTNVLYSLLSLHAHPENEACKALIQLILDNEKFLKITLRYSDLSLNELVKKKDDFKYLDRSLTNSAIKGMLASDRLDEFSRQFYTNLLENRDSTLHPSKVIDLANTSLKGKKIDISRTGKRLESIGENYINVRVQDYLNFITKKNEYRTEYGKKRGLNIREYFRSDKQAKHDISLREIILSQRSSNTRDKTHFTFNNVKYYAVTLDDLLIQYDQKEMRGHSDERAFPVFFKPSFLLSKLIKILPIKTDDYKKAYFKALTARGFNRDIKRSEDIINVVNYLKNQGIDNEEIIYNLISEDLFLEKYREGQKDPQFNQGQFIEDALNKQFAEKQEELNKAKNELSKVSLTALEVSTENVTLQKKVSEKEHTTLVYDTAIKELHRKIKKLEKSRQVASSPQLGIAFENEKDEKIRLLEIRLDEERKKSVAKDFKSVIDKEFKRWQFKSLWLLSFTVPLLVASLILSYIFKDKIEAYKVYLTIVIPVVIALLNAFVFGVIFIRFFNDSNKEAKRKKIERDYQTEIENSLH
jgi:hypothetical protein